MTTELTAFRDEARVRFDAIDQRFDAVDRRFDAVEQRLDAVEHRLDSVEHRLGAIDSRLDETNRRIGVLHEDVIARIALLGEQFASHAPRRSRKRKR